MLAVALPFVLDDFLIGEATNVLIWAIVGMGLMVLTGHAGQPRLGHAAFLAAGCYANAILMDRFGLPFLASFTLAGVLTGLAGVVIAIPRLQAPRHLSRHRDAGALDPGRGHHHPGRGRGPEAWRDSPPRRIVIAGVEVDRYVSPDRFYWLCLAVAALVTLGYRNILRAPLGRAFTAVRDSEVSAQAMGVSPARTKAAAFGLSCAVTGWAGALMGHYFHTFNHEAFTFVISIKLLLMIVIGGLGAIQGAWYGAVVVGLIPQALNVARDRVTDVFGGAGLAVPGLEAGIFALILIVILLIEPHGIHGRLSKWKVWFDLLPLLPPGHVPPPEALSEDGAFSVSLLEFRGVTLRFGGVRGAGSGLVRRGSGARSSPSWCRTAPGSRRCSTLSRASTIRPKARSASREGALRIARPRKWPGSASPRTFQNIELFEHSTVLENLLVGRHARARASLVSQIPVHPRGSARGEFAHRSAVERIIDFLDLQPYREMTIAGLAHGVRKVVEIGRALARSPG